jgi:CMP/dCMP kinase
MNKFVYVYDDHGASVYYGDENITALLKDAHIDQAASIMGTNSDVREIVLIWQRAIARERSVVLDGRDAGSVVFPQADYKFFLTALPEVRAQRWRAAQAEKGNMFSDECALQEVLQRDERDERRAVAPLTIAPGATIIDSSLLSIDEVIQDMMKIIENEWL